MWNLKNKTNKYRGKERGETMKQTLNYREQMDGYQRGGLGRDNFDNGVQERHLFDHLVLCGGVESWTVT